MEQLLRTFKKPVLIVSTKVGRGMYTMGDALKEAFDDPEAVHHYAIEDFLPRAGVREDVVRYKMIANHFPFILYMIYKIPIFYHRKYWREKIFSRRGLPGLGETLAQLKIETVVCVSHRAAFWVSNHKRLKGGGFELWDLLGEYGNNYGYKYLFWDQLDGFLSPVSRSRLRFRIPRRVRFERVALPVRRDYAALSKTAGSPGKVLLICGFWGQGPILDILKALLERAPKLGVYVVCGENRKAFEATLRYARRRPNIEVFPVVESLVPFLRECASVITKPGISTLLEAHAAHRKIFLLKGMPVAEDNNADYAVRHFGAEWYHVDGFVRWLEAQDRR
jgi:hypothetical protein